jgi:magnesium chelatase subunit I
VDVASPNDIKERVEVIKRRDAYETDTAVFMKRWRAADTKLRKAILAGRERLSSVASSDETLGDCAELCIAMRRDLQQGSAKSSRTFWDDRTGLDTRHDCLAASGD